MINYPNALQPPPAGVTLPDRFLPLTRPTGSSGNLGPTLRTSDSSLTNSSSSQPANNSTPSLSSNGTSTALNGSAPIPIFNPNPLNGSSNPGLLPTNVGQHVLNADGEVDGSDIGLGKQDPNRPNDADSDRGLSPAAKGGAVAGSLMVFVILLLIAFLVRKIHRKAAKRKDVEIPGSGTTSSSSHDYTSHHHLH